MQTTLAHTFTDVDGHEVTLTFKNTLLGAIRYTVMRQRFITPDMADAPVRGDFIFVAAWIVDVAGTDWRPPDDTSTPEEFAASYHAFAALFADVDQFHEVVWVVNEFKGIHKAEEELPDAALTPEEIADPNGSKRARATDVVSGKPLRKSRAPNSV
jgi:hypothetical protein